MSKPRWAEKKPKTWEQLEFNKNFLRRVEEECGSLTCEYCGKDNLIIYEWNDTDRNLELMATADHFYPASKYPNLKQEEKNLIVSCYECNYKKKDKIFEVEKINFPRNKSIKKELKSLL